MKVNSVKTNFILNSIRVFFGALVGIITMPYINNVLGPVNLGKVEFVNTIIRYFMLFSALGIPMYGIREIAKVRDNVEERSILTWELLSILVITSFIAYAVLFGIIINLNAFIAYKNLIILMSSMILFTNIGAEWFFQGMENQKYITIRFTIIRVLTLILLFLIVKNENDYFWYALIIVLNLCGSNIFNIFFIFKNTKRVDFKVLDIKRHIKPIFTIFAGTIAINIYLQLDMLLIGMISGDKYVGFYSVANKLIRFVISFITIAGAVLLPKLSRLYKENKYMYTLYLKKGLDIILILSLISTIIFFYNADWIINIMAGESFSQAIITMKILSPLCIIVGLAYFIGFLILYTQNKENIYTIAVVISAVFSLLINYFAIKKYNHNGAAVTALSSELIGIIVMFFLYRRKIIELKIIDINELKIVLSAFIVFILNYISFYLLDFCVSTRYNISMILLSFTLYLGILLILKEQTTRNLLYNIMKNFK